MGIIINPPENIQPPVFVFEGAVNYKIKCNKYLQQLKEYCIKISPNELYIGEIVNYSVADGYASYMLAKTNPLTLIHIKLYDAYWYEGIEHFPKSAIIEKIKNQIAIKKIFG